MRSIFLTTLTQSSIARPNAVNGASQFTTHVATDWLSDLTLEDKKIINMIDGLFSELQVPAFDQARVRQKSSRQSGFIPKDLET